MSRNSSLPPEGTGSVSVPTGGGVFLRRLAHVGARYGPKPWVRYSPPVFGLAFAALLPERRAAVRGNLRRVLGERGRLEETLDVARTFTTYARCLAESLAAGRPEADRALCTFRGREHLDRVFESSRGVMLVTAHTGAWDAAARLLASDAERSVMIAMMREPDPRARKLHDDVRQRAGVRVLHVGGHPLDALPMLHHLGAGGIAAVQIDRVPPGARAIDVSLFGAAFQVPEGPFRIAAMAGVPVLPLFVRRQAMFEYEFHVAPAIELPRRPTGQELSLAAQRAADEMGRFIRANPTQWFHFGP